MEAFLAERRSRLVIPDLFDRRPSALRCEDIIFARYPPPDTGWPWGLLCCWPIAFTAMVAADSDAFARAAYTVEFFHTVDELAEAESRLLTNLGPHEARQVRPMGAGIGHS
ncbi:MAG TPA: hypothetical protein VF503_25025 [Sphingobium sp.]|uniref:hypothetical protein n=1 Tax=Sphingobium sp. TaxID=1912891 RepID=UPI002ED64D0F